LRKCVKARKNLLTYSPLYHDALEDSGPIAEKQKPYFAARSFVVQPAPKLYLFTYMLAKIFNINAFHSLISPLLCKNSG